MFSTSGFLAFIHPSSGHPDSVPHFPSLGIDPLHDTTVSLGRLVLRLRLLMDLWRRPLSSVFHLTSTIFLKVFVPLPAFSIVVPVTAPVHAPIPVIIPVPVLVIVPDPVPTPLLFAFDISSVPAPGTRFSPW